MKGRHLCLYAHAICTCIWTALLLIAATAPHVPKKNNLIATPRWSRTRQHTSAYVSIRQHTSAYVSIRQHTSAAPPAGAVKEKLFYRAARTPVSRKQMEKVYWLEYIAATWVYSNNSNASKAYIHTSLLLITRHHYGAPTAVKQIEQVKNIRASQHMG